MRGTPTAETPASLKIVRCAAYTRKLVIGIRKGSAIGIEKGSAGRGEGRRYLAFLGSLPVLAFIDSRKR